VPMYFVAHGARFPAPGDFPATFSFARGREGDSSGRWLLIPPRDEMDFSMLRARSIQIDAQVLQTLTATATSVGLRG